MFLLRFFDLNNPTIQVVVPPDALPVPAGGLNGGNGALGMQMMEHMLGSVARLAER
jgi:hypothetical protein